MTCRRKKRSKIRASFDAARKDIAVIAAKKRCKMEEMHVLDAEGVRVVTFRVFRQAVGRS
jgi:hypothetical protein